MFGRSGIAAPVENGHSPLTAQSTVCKVHLGLAVTDYVSITDSIKRGSRVVARARQKNRAEGGGCVPQRRARNYHSAWGVGRIGALVGSRACRHRPTSWRASKLGPLGLFKGPHRYVRCGMGQRHRRITGIRFPREGMSTRAPPQHLQVPSTPLHRGMTGGPRDFKAAKKTHPARSALGGMSIVPWKCKVVSLSLRFASEYSKGLLKDFGANFSFERFVFVDSALLQGASTCLRSSSEMGASPSPV